MVGGGEGEQAVHSAEEILCASTRTASAPGAGSSAEVTRQQSSGLRVCYLAWLFMHRSKMQNPVPNLSQPDVELHLLQAKGPPLRQGVRESCGSQTGCASQEVGGHSGSP